MLIFEISKKGRKSDYLPACDVPLSALPQASKLRKDPPKLPELSEIELTRHYTRLAKQAFGVNSGFYPLGSCTMKYNPRVNEVTASNPNFMGIHPLQPLESAKGCREVLDLAESLLCEVTGMNAMSFQPAAGAHGEYTGLLLIKKYHELRGDHLRTKIIIPDSAHGTNPASAAMVGYSVVNIPSDANGCVDMDALKKACTDEIAGLMLTNPNTLGLFDPNILEITQLVHACGGLNYYDGANLNAIMGKSRPGDMGFDVVHLNLHKTFSTPHGGGGPGSGPVGCKNILKSYLPDSIMIEGRKPESIGQVRSFYGNFGIVVRALTYILSLGSDGLKAASETAVLNANYLMHQVKEYFPVAYDHVCMHEFVLTLEKTKHDKNISALDVAKGLIDYGMHPPTMYFPLIVHEALMLEPTETESRESLDQAAMAFKAIKEKIDMDPDALHAAPLSTPIGRPDEVNAARNPILRYTSK
ncbi:MAG: aminomethyl-transferring glycine dehydrogenase subunit GcvPB [Clostridiales bacterium]|nr:aminomethyl-transferring glycine dehydrogenase subunit GcvPB [Clostridiales bacterium]